jgi:hypothetical protein
MSKGDCDLRASHILAEIPPGSTGNTVLTLGFADPFDIGLKFGTIKTSSSRFVDLIVLLAVDSDANRAYKRDVMEDAVQVDQFLRFKHLEGSMENCGDGRHTVPQVLSIGVCRQYGDIGILANTNS